MSSSDRRRITSRSTWLATLLIFVAGSAVTRAEQNGIVIVGDVRFTVITPSCVRIEQSPGGKFVDDRSLVAVNRDMRTADYKVSEEGQTTILETKAIRLRYVADEKPLSADNLVVEITAPGAQSKRWTPGTKNTGNLGGTVRTLDGWDGGGDLGEGLLSRDGWYCLDDSKTPLFTADWVRARPEGSGTDWYFFSYGTNFKAALQSFTAIAGRIPLPRRYTLGSWYSRYWPYTSDEYRSIVKEYAEHNFPLDVLVLDMDWHKDGWTGYSWNRKLLPDAEGLLKWVHEQGLHVTLNDHPADGVGPHEDRYPDFMHALNENPASQKTLPYDAGSKAYLTAHYDNMMQPLVKDGVDFWWLDWQQYPSTRSIPQLTNLFWLNHYYFQRTQADDKRGQDLTRWGGWGSHRYPIQFSGDATTTWKSLAFQVPFTSTAGNVGAFFWSHDIGGHQGGRNEESYVRWVQFGATTTALRSHSTRNAEMDRRPWTYAKWAEDSMRQSFHLRSELMPYVYSSVSQSTSESIPLNRPMYLNYPNQERAYHSPQQYLFGDHLLVAPITSPGIGPNRVGTQVVWFPPGDDWFNLFTGEREAGGTEKLVAADINEFPLYVRGGVPIPMRPYSPRMTTAPLDTLVIRAYPGKIGSYTLYEDDGVSKAYEQRQFATTLLTYSATDKQVTIDVAATEGTFEEQLNQRATVIELPCTTRGTLVFHNDASVRPTISYDATTFVNTVTIPARSIRRSHRIVIETTPLDPEGFELMARIRRAGAASKASLAIRTADHIELARALKSLPSGTDPLPLLASFGVGVFEKNETSYRWPEKGTLGFYSPADVIDGEKITLTTGKDELVMTLTHDANAGGFTPVPLKSSDQLPDEPNRFVTSELRFAISGQPVTLEGPTSPINFAADARNVAPKAHVTSTTGTKESPASGVIDGHVGGYPAARKDEWSSEKEKAGATLTLTWDAPQKIDRVWLFDRQNLDDQITAGELMFDTGEPIRFGELPNDASRAGDISFAPRTTKSLTIRIMDVKQSTENIGLAEVVVFKSAN